MTARRGRQCGAGACPHRSRHHFSHTWPDRGGPEGDLMELNGRTSPQMLRRYGASARSTRDRIMTARENTGSDHASLDPGRRLADLPGITSP
ncbi:MAG: hypothetical protein M3Z75_15675 [Actinomycetota bacterium]|nr:hypothetical protein [Actinomycetota bacterium]